MQQFEDLKIAIDNNKSIVAELCNYDGEHPEIVICIQQDGIAIQDICLVRPHTDENDDRDKDSTDIDCLVWGESSEEDYSHKFIIPLYKDEEEGAT